MIARDVDRDRLRGSVLIAAGLVAAFVIQAAAPLAGPPLFDGVIVIEPYLWFDPPPGQPGGATGTSQKLAVVQGKSAVLIASTSESPPQAQLFGDSGALTVAPDATAIDVTIEPVAKPADPTAGYIDGNVYRFSLTDQLGRTVTAPREAEVSLLLRPADLGLLDATIVRFDGVRWQPLPTEGLGPAGFLAIVTEFGTYALLASGESPYPTTAATPTTPTTPTAPITPGSAPSNDVPQASPGPRASHDIPIDPGLLFIVTASLLAAVALTASASRRRRRYRGPRGWGPRGDLDDY